MQRLSPTRIPHLAAALLVCLPLAAQTPPAKPSAAIPATQPITIPAAPATPPQPAQHRAEITFSNGQLNVVANNSSLNQILYDIAHATGMKITGGVTDERVFGQYGPAAPASVLAMLLDGTGSNMLLVSTPGHSSTPTELVLTPRHGGPTPPNPNAIFAEQREQDEHEREEKERDERDRQQQAARPTRGPGRAQEQPPGASPQTPATPATPGATTPDSSSSNTQQSPNGVKTPQQIFEQLQKMNQQQNTTTPQ